MSWQRMLVVLGMAAALAGCDAQDAARRNLAAGFSDYSARQYDEAEKAADSYLEKHASEKYADEAYYLRGLARLGRSDKTGAAADLETAIARTQRAELKAKAYRTLGDMASDAEQFAQAIGYFNEAIRHYLPGPVDPYVFYRMGAAMQALGQWEAARPWFQRVIESRGDAYLVQRAAARRDVRNYALQFGAYSDRNGALEAARRLQAAGVNVYTVSETRDGKPLYLVRAGAFRTYAEVDRAREGLIAKYPMIAIVP